MEELTLWQEDPPAKTYPWLDNVKAWMDNGADCSGISVASLIRALPVGFSGKTSLAHCPPTTDMISLPCCGGSLEHSLECPMVDGEPEEWWSDPSGQQSGGCLTLNTLEWPNDAAVCSLSQVLEESVDPKYCLSPKACLGVLRRAERRGKKLPAHLEEALRAVVQELTPTE